jgi:hypothetical protein
MAQVRGKAGTATYRKDDRLMFRALVPMLVMGILTYFLFWSGVQTMGFLGGGAGCVVMGLGFWCVSDVFSLEAAADQYYGGAGAISVARGRSTVCRAPRRLKESWPEFFLQ